MIASSALDSAYMLTGHSPTGGPAREAAMIAAAQADPDAFADLYRVYYPLVYSFVLRRTGDTSTAEDITGEVFLSAFKALPRYQWRGIPFSAWLYRIAATTIASHHRRNGSIIYVPLENPECPIAEPASEEAGPELCLELMEQARSRRDLLARAMHLLTADQLRAIRLRYSGTELMPLAEVGRAMNRSEGAVKLLLHRATASLRRAIADLDVYSPASRATMGTVASIFPSWTTM
ncbi:MAG: RNA polymerase sigma factor [Chloroflexia bacterium]